MLGILLAGGIITAPAASDPLDTWYWRNPSPQGNPLHGVCYGADEFVAVGANGTVMTSPDGEAWLNQEPGTRIPLNDVVHAAGRYVAVGEFGLILHSTDARTWQPADSPWFYHLNAVTWGNGLFVAVGEDTAILTSPDGITWTLRATGTEPLNDVAFGNGKFLAVGGEEAVRSVSIATQIMLISSNGTHWQGRTPGVRGALSAAHFWKDKFFVGVFEGSPNWCFVISSSDGSSWIPSSGNAYASTPINCFVGDDSSLFAFMGSRSVHVYYPITTSDGQTWVQGAGANTNGYALGAAAGSDVLVACGTRPYWTYGAIVTIRRDSEPWVPLFPDTPSVRDLIRGSGRVGGLVDVSTNGGYFTYASFTTNGYHWSSNTISVAPYSSFYHGNGRFVARRADIHALAASEDGTNWSAHTNLPSSPFINLVGGNGVWIYQTDGSSYWRSESLDDWEPYGLPGGGSWDQMPLAYGGGTFLWFDRSSGVAHKSVDGVVWHASLVSGAPGLAWFKYSHDRWLGGNPNGEAFVSSNGQDWNALGPFGGNLWTSDLDYGVGTYVASINRNNAGALITSSDEGISWAVRRPGGVEPWSKAMVAFDSVLVMPWNYSVLMQSAPLSPAAPAIVSQLNHRVLLPEQTSNLLGETYGTEPLTHAWYRDGSELPEADEPLLALRHLPEGASHEYALVTSNAYGSVTNGPVRVVVGRPATLGLASGDELAGSLSGTAGLTYRVDYRDGSPAAGDWQTLTNLILTGTSGVFVDAPPTNRFYRAELIP